MGIKKHYHGKERIGQNELKYVYESAKERTESHPELTEEYRKVVKELPVYKDRNEAIKKAFELHEKGVSHCQVWAKIGKDDEYFFIEDYYIVSNDNLKLMAAEYIGMEQIAVI